MISSLRDKPFLYLAFFSSSPPAGVDSSLLAASSFSFSFSPSTPLPRPSSPSLSEPSLLSSSTSLSGAPKGLTGLSLLMIGGAPGDAKLLILDPPNTLPKALPPPKPPPPKPPPPNAEEDEPFTVANGDGAEASLLPKLSVGVGMFGAAADLLGAAAPKDANGDAEPAAPPPKTLLVAPADAKGEEEDEASLAKPEAANAAFDVCGC